MRSRIAWALTAIAAVAVVADAIIISRFLALWSEDAVAVHGFPFVSGAVLGCTAMGALIVTRLPAHPIGWLLNLVGFTTSLGLLAEASSLWIVDEGGPGPGWLGGVAGWASLMLGGPLALTGVAFLFLLAPSGRFLSARWRAFSALPALGAMMCTVATMTLVSPFEVDLRDDRIFGGTGDGPLQAQLWWSSGLLMITAGLVGSLVSMLVRLARSDGAQRQQLRLIALSAALVTCGFLALIAVQQLNGGRQTWLSGLPLFVSYFCLPLLFGVAVLRFRLYDIEVIVNRSLVVAIATGFAALGYTGIVVAIGRLVDSRTGGFWVSLLATATVALAFQPLRARVVQVANRLAFGPRAQPYEALASFSAQLSATPSAEQLLGATAEVAAALVGAETVEVRLESADGDTLRAAWSRDGEGPGRSGTPENVPITDGAGAAASLDIGLRHGRRLSARDRQVLQDLSTQAAPAFRNLALEQQLRTEVARLAGATQQLSESRRRIVQAEDTARRHMEAALARDILPRLAPVATAVHELAQHPVDDRGRQKLDRLVEETSATLAALRELTRGIFPAMLTRSGLAAAVGSLLTGESASTTLTHEGVEGVRYSPDIEAAAYVACREAMQAATPPSCITLSGSDEGLEVVIQGSSLDVFDWSACLDRVAAAGGSLTVHGPDRASVTLPRESALTG